MNFSAKRIVVSGIVAGIVVSFLFTHTHVGFLMMKGANYLYSMLPESVARFLRSQTYVTILFVWSMIFVGFLVWIVRGDFFGAEPEPRRESFELIDEGDTDDEPPVQNNT